jgi:hypothetical protein
MTRCEGLWIREMNPGTSPCLSPFSLRSDIVSSLSKLQGVYSKGNLMMVCLEVPVSRMRSSRVGATKLVTSHSL